MQTTQLNVAQLMGEFLGKENGRITRKIMSSEFSEELRAQHANFFGGSAAPVAIDSTRLGTDDDGSLAGGVEGAPRAGQLSQPASTSSATTQQQQPSAPAQKITHSSAAKRSLREHLELLEGKNPSAVSEEETQEQLVFTDGLLVEKVITQLQLPAEQRAAVQAAADSSGRISFKALSRALNDMASQNQQSTPLAKPEVAAESVQQLIGSLSQVKEKSVEPQTARLQLKAKGSYSLRELNGLLNHIASRTAQEEAAAKDNLVGAQSSALSNDKASYQISAAAKSSAALQRPTHDLVPSFSLADSSGVKNQEIQAALHDIPAQDRKFTEQVLQFQQQTEAGDSVELRQHINGKPQVAGLTGIGTGEQAQPSAKEETLLSASKSSAAPVGSADRESVQTFVNARAPQTQVPSQLENSPAGRTDGTGFLQANNVQVSLASGEEQASLTRRLTGEGQDYEANTVFDKELSDTTGSRAKIKAGSNTEGAFSQNQDTMQEELSHHQMGKISSRSPHDHQVLPTALNETQTGNQGSVAAGAETLQKNTLSLNESGWEVKLAQRIHSIQGQDRNQLTLELEPKELGRLSVRIETQQNQVTAFIVADSERARALLVQNSSLLQNSLQEQGLVLDQISVDIRQQKNEQQASQQLHYQRKRRSGISSISAVNQANISAQQVYERNSGNQIISLFT